MRIHEASARPGFLWRRLIFLPILMSTSLVCAAQSVGGPAGSFALAARLGRAGTLVYPNAVGTTTPTPSTNVPLRKPDSLDAPGLYVWRDGDGSWNIGLVGSGDTIAFSGELTSPAPISIDPVQNDGNVLQPENPNRARFDFVAVGKVSRIARFRTDADSIDFEVHVNGSDETAQVFVGSTKLNPGRTSFQIAEQASGGGPAQNASPTQQPPATSQATSGAANGGGPGQVRP
jgi:hypothetical protein